jgi:hypothetical protein
MQLIDFYTNVFGNPGAPTTGTVASKWVVLPPGYSRSALPKQLRGLPSYQANTTGVWLLGRTYVANPSDLASAKAVQLQYSLAPAVTSAQRVTDVGSIATASVSDTAASTSPSLACRLHSTLHH